MQKIMFNERFGLETDTLNGAKNMTRRLIPQKVLNAVPTYQEEYLAGALEPISIEDAIMNMCGPEKIFKVGYEIGEIVAVAQAYKYIYQFDCVPTWIPSSKDPNGFIKWDESKGYNNKMFVKAEYMPRQIKITGKKVERLQAISDEDCLREGIVCKHIGDEDCYTVGDFLLWDKYLRQRAFSTPRKAYEVLIRNMQGNKVWNSNPYVFAYTYELVK